MLPNKSKMTENKAWQWHMIMSGGGSTQVPFPEIDHEELPEPNPQNKEGV